jgi:hypothetical protein
LENFIAITQPINLRLSKPYLPAVETGKMGTEKKMMVFVGKSEISIKRNTMSVIVDNCKLLK